MGILNDFYSKTAQLEGSIEFKDLPDQFKAWVLHNLQELKYDEVFYHYMEKPTILLQDKIKADSELLDDMFEWYTEKNPIGDYDTMAADYITSFLEGYKIEEGEFISEEAARQVAQIYGIELSDEDIDKVSRNVREQEYRDRGLPFRLRLD